ncbi:hypothetical protein [Alteraurantiacibacter aquimixticola]|uniref:Uncharacterized protein n=1 Tax=Alteraurantiacibacter aquimixticola TaxID=2489173 RepID=A0A4T3F2T4_9SPHN|nr:hypothetical protein [Alteraurantiacibacter aquimixticola]TIX51448.1 hypothetical protein E5222_03035 [Alteraurantiacibacter aquimixticola]
MDPTVAVILDYIPLVVGGAVLISLAGVWASVHNTKLKIKNGYPLEGMWGQSLKPEVSSEGMERVRMLTQENAALRAELSAIKERTANLEKIVTDSGFQLTHQIDRLRDREEMQ